MGRAVELCLGLALLVPPFIFGGRQAYGQLALAVLVLAAFVFWMIRKITSGPVVISLARAEVLLPLAAISFTFITWISLPSGLIRMLSPGIQRLLPEWSTKSFGVGSEWHSFSLTPGLSREATLLFVLYVFLFWITLDTVRHRDSIQRLLRMLFIAGVGVSAVGYLFWNGKFYWLWDIWWVDPERQVRAPFTNRNHFAGFLALTLGPGAAILMRLIREGRRANYSTTENPSNSRRLHDFKILLAAGGLTLIFAGIGLSQSRGGSIVGLTVAAACLAGWFRTGQNRVTSVAAAAVILLSSLGLVAAFGRQDPFQRTAQMLEGNQSLDDISNARLQLWKADLHAIADFPLMGSGPGSHQYVYPLYLEKAHRYTFTHAENCYVQILVECGLAGVVLLLAGIIFVVRWSWRGLQRDGRETSRSASELSLAVAVSLLAALVHGLVDFVWYVPAYTATVAVLAGLARSLARRKESLEFQDWPPTLYNRSSTLDLRRSIFGGGLITAGMVLALFIGERFAQAVPGEYAWNAYYRLLPAEMEDGQPENSNNLEERAAWLAKVCQHGSVDPEPYYRLGLAKLELFLQHQKASAKPAGLLETRRIIQETRFPNPAAARAWLQTRYGADLPLLESAQAALAESLDRCPLLGSSYLHLAKLYFLDQSTHQDSDSYCRQAQLTRPYDPEVHLQVGLEEWVTGDRPKARAAWWRACELHHPCQSRLLPLLTAQLPAQEIVEYLPLDFEGLKWLALREADLGRRHDSCVAAEKAQQAVEKDPMQAKNPAFWIALSELYQQAELRPQAEACVRKAVRLAPDRLGIHLLLIRWLMEDGQWKAALEQAQDSRQQFLNRPDVQALVDDILILKGRPAPAKEVSRDPIGERGQRLTREPKHIR